MKKLSIYEKAQLYDEVIERANSLLSDNQLGNAWIYKLLPELKENGGEKIKEKLIDTFNFYDPAMNSPYLLGIHRKDILAWLEKQGEEESIDTVSLIQQRVDALADIVEEQKLTDNDEPKFKVGDWCIDNVDGTIFQIVKVLGNIYTYKTNEGKEYSCTHYWLKNNARLWTIQDAKDGDVLVCEGCEYLLFKSFSNTDGIIKLYCWYNRQTNNFHTSTDIKPRKEANIYPATREQRELLFAKIKETGYEWDSEKKELKKIVFPIYKIGETIAKKHNSDINHFDFFTITDITGGKYWYNGRIICNITEQDEWEIHKPVSQKSSEWSKEDDFNLAWIVETLLGLDGDKEYTDSCKKMAKWLKSIRLQKQLNKSTLAAEIEKLEKLYCYGKSDGMLIAKSVFDSIKNIIGTIEMKDVDLEKEIQTFSMELAMKENNGDWEKDIRATAKYFFELGLKAQKGK